MAARMSEKDFAEYLRRIGAKEPHFRILGTPLCELQVIGPSKVRDEDDQWTVVACPKCLAHAPRD